MKTSALNTIKSNHPANKLTIAGLLNSSMQTQFKSTMASMSGLASKLPPSLQKMLSLKLEGVPGAKHSLIKPTELQNTRFYHMKNLDKSSSTIKTDKKVSTSELFLSGKVSTDSDEVIAPKELQPIIQKASQEHNVPVALINAVIKQESNFKPKAVSHAGASGLMQLMPGTAKDMGCKDVFDAEENVMAGTKYLSKMLKKHKGDVTLALASYNAGPGNVAKYGNKVPPFKETQAYVKKVGSYYQANLNSTKKPLLFG